MGKAVTATEAVRMFSEIFNSIKYRGEEFTILRGGKPIAVMSPVEVPVKQRTLGELKEILKSLPELDDEAVRFEDDLKKIRNNQPALPAKI